MKTFTAAVRRFGQVSCGLWGSMLVLACSVDVEDEELSGKSEQALTPLVSKQSLAFHWAPFHVQDVNKHYLDGKADYLSRVDYDGDFITTNNWDDIRSFNTPSHAYFALSESATHWFLYYMFYHPIDWSTGFDSEHENDAEGTLVFVRKDGTAFGKFEGMITQAHGEFFPYRDPNVPLTKGTANRTVNTVMSMVSSSETFPRPLTYQEAEGHGFYACGSHITNCLRADDGIRYLPSQTVAAVPPATIPNGVQVAVNYSLIDLAAPGGLYSRRGDTTLFTPNGVNFRGDDSNDCGDGITVTCSENSAGAIWGWGDFSFRNDPAGFVRRHFNFGSLTPPSTGYVRNDFACGHDICQTGTPLVGGEFPCVMCARQVCAVDPFCCTYAWDGICVSEVGSVCGLGCN